MLTQWEERGIKKGRRQGLQEGRTEGQVIGVIQGARSVLLRQMRNKFGDLPAEIERKIQGIEDTSVLDDLLLRILHANTMTDMGLDKI